LKVLAIRLGNFFKEEETMSKYLKLGILAVAMIAVAVVVTAAVGGALTTSNVAPVAPVAPAKVAGPGSLGNPPLFTDFQGGDTCATAVDLGTLPAVFSGTTIGYANDYDEVCPYTGGTAPDVVYSYTPAANMTVMASLCTPGTNTDYDTKLYVYENACPGTVAACVDDACDAPSYPYYVSEAMVDLVAGSTYYFVVDGYGTASGNYTLGVEEIIIQDCPCPPDADLDEGAMDPDCGDDPGGMDPTGGCNTDPSGATGFVQIACNTTICGTTSTFGTSRDTDWFNLNLPVADTVRVTLTSSADLFLFELGPTDCATTGLIQQLDQTNCAGTGEMVINGVAGDNWIFVGPQHFGDPILACPTEYTLTVNCDTVPVDLQSFIVE
jgi:hypothetical protein